MVKQQIGIFAFNQTCNYFDSKDIKCVLLHTASVCSEGADVKEISCLWNITSKQTKIEKNNNTSGENVIPQNVSTVHMFFSE